MNKNKGTFGLALASAPAPTVTFLASDASDGIDASGSSEVVRLTNGLRDTTVGRYSKGVESGASVTTLAFADLIGLLLYGALGAVKTTGSAAPYNHVFTLGESLPELRFTQQVGSSSAPLQQLAGAKVETLSISADEARPLAVKLSLAGTRATWLSATAWNGPEFDAAKGWFTTAGAKVKLALVGSSPATVPASISLSSFEAQVQSGMTPMRPFGSVEAEVQQEGEATVTASLSGTTTDTSVYRLVKTGAASGTEVSTAVVTGSLQVEFPHTTKNWKLVLDFPALPWNVNAMGVDTAGGPFDLQLSTDGAIAVNGTSVTATLQNDVAKYSA